MSWYVREEIKIAEIAILRAGLQGRTALLRDAISAEKSCGIVAVARWLLRCVYGSDMKAVQELYKFAVRDIRERVKDGQGDEGQDIGLHSEVGEARIP